MPQPDPSPRSKPAMGSRAATPVPIPVQTDTRNKLKQFIAENTSLGLGTHVVLKLASTLPENQHYKVCADTTKKRVRPSLEEAAAAEFAAAEVPKVPRKQRCVEPPKEVRYDGSDHCILFTTRGKCSFRKTGFCRLNAKNVMSGSASRKKITALTNTIIFEVKVVNL
ncbi:hypothetical protein ElyMa_003070000 [Elysia marginata]|uniref:FLYWCH-type domain-containing protein n=1 Tax=Elysia marginata TaxID=1093978 RepID=A0AAV4IKH4_9GAST|nr:hypothetical protein ElyMa_003070000 [Elysia marginata]